MAIFAIQPVYLYAAHIVAFTDGSPTYTVGSWQRLFCHTKVLLWHTGDADNEAADAGKQKQKRTRNVAKQKQQDTASVADMQVDSNDEAVISVAPCEMVTPSLSLHAIPFIALLSSVEYVAPADALPLMMLCFSITG